MLVDQYRLTYVAFLVVAPLALVGAVADAASGCASAPSARTRRRPTPPASASPGCATAALILGGALMAVGGAFLTLAVLGSFTLDIIAGRGWVSIALVIFGRWRIWRGVGGCAPLRRRSTPCSCSCAITDAFAHVPRRAADRAAVPGRDRCAGAVGPRTSPIPAHISSRTAGPDAWTTSDARIER